MRVRALMAAEFSRKADATSCATSLRYPSRPYFFSGEFLHEKAMVDSFSLEAEGSAARLTPLALRKASVGAEESVTPERYQILPSLVPINDTQVIETISQFTEPVLAFGAQS